MVLRISLVYGGREFRSRVTAEMIESAKSKRAQERAEARRSAEATLRRIGEQDANGFYADLL
jgi:F0F1-type ATP synthase membrane subunit b/b'